MTSIDLAPDPPTRSKKRWIFGAAAVLVLVAGVAIVLTMTLGDRHTPQTLRFVVPAGTAERASRGVTVQILPTELEVRVGDRIIIKNDDDTDYSVGPYVVRQGQTLEQTFRRPGAITGECGLTPTNEIRIFIT